MLRVNPLRAAGPLASPAACGGGGAPAAAAEAPPPLYTLAALGSARLVRVRVRARVRGRVRGRVRVRARVRVRVRVRARVRGRIRVRVSLGSARLSSGGAGLRVSFEPKERVRRSSERVPGQG
eukprot:scaffold73344_cov33-Phaeocystis_antarctica.AAC.1